MATTLQFKFSSNCYQAGLVTIFPWDSCPYRQKVLPLLPQTPATKKILLSAVVLLCGMSAFAQVQWGPWVSEARENMERSGLDGEKWKLDELLFGLLQNVSAILSERDAFMVLNLYSNGYSAALGETVVREAFKNQFLQMSSGELAFNDSFGKVLPLSIYVRLKR